MKSRLFTTAIACALAAAACETAGERTLGIDGSGVVAGIIGVDVIGSGVLGSGSPVMRDVEVVLRSLTGRGIIARTMSQANGVFFFQNVPIGEYEVTVSPGSVPDSLVLLRVDSAHVRLGANDTTVATIVLSYPTVSLTEARTVALGRSVFVEGVVLNAWPTYGDSTIHLAGPESGLRLIRVAPTGVVVGDSVRVRGVRGTRDGQPVLHSANAIFLRTVEPRQPETVDTWTAARADGGRLDALFVRVGPSAITDSASLATGDFRLTINDGSGPLDVVLDRNILFRLNLAGPLFEHTLEASGLLVPRESAGGDWTLKPRIATEAITRHVPPPTPPAADGGYGTAGRLRGG